MKYEIKLNAEYGYHEVLPKPQEEELRTYYADKYYQDENATYQHSYSIEEQNYFRTKISQKAYIAESILGSGSGKSLLDIGCGEGFAMDFFLEKGWDVHGVDFSDFGIRSVHPHLLSKLSQGNINLILKDLSLTNKRYDLIWLDNVLEHVVNPGELLEILGTLTVSGGVLIVEVPNDFSEFQQALLGSGKVDKKYWEAYPDHLIYFNRDSLMRLCKSSGWNTEKIIADFPIEWFLMNSHSNYSREKSLGKEAHNSRVFFENFLADTASSQESIIEFYEAMSKLGQGRQIIGFFSKA